MQAARRLRERYSLLPAFCLRPSDVLVVVEERLLRDRLVDHLHLGQDLVDDLLLEQGSPDFGEGLGVLLVEFPDLLLLAGILADPLDESLSDLVVGNLDIGLLADLRKDQSEPNPTLGDLAVVGPGLLLGGALVREGAVVRFMSPSTCAQTAANSCSTRLGGSSKLYLASRASRSSFLTLRRDWASKSRWMAPRIASFSLSRDSMPKPLASSSSIFSSPGASTSFTVTSNSASLPARCARQVVFGEGHLHELGVARLEADELLLEARDEGVGAELDPDVLALAALELRAVDAADEVDHDAVAIGGRAVLRREGAVLLGHPLERFVDLGVGDLGDRLLHRDVRQVGELEGSAAPRGRP